jgi:effector-binding domain-containing protein
MKDLFTVGEIAELFDINRKTLRYYDEIDLFKPNYIDKKNNYRYYKINQFEKLNTIIYLKELGMSLSAIKFHLDNLSTSNVINLFKNQESLIEQKIEELKFIQSKIKNRIAKLNDSVNYEKLNKITEINFDDRMVVVLREKVNSKKDLELSIRKLENKAHKKSSIFLGKVGVSISIDKLKSGLFKEYDSTFILLENENYNKDMLKIIPKGTYVCIRFNGIHDEADVYYKKLLNYIDEKGYEILDDSIEITLIDFGITSNILEFVTEIQILVKKC